MYKRALIPSLTRLLSYLLETVKIKRLLFQVCLAFACVSSGAVFAQTVNDDEAALRLLADRFYHAYESDDQKEFLSLWSSRSLDPESKPNPAPKWEQKRLISLEIQTVRVSGDDANVRVRVRFIAVLKPGAKASPNNLFSGNDTFLTLRCVKENGVWKALAHALTEDDLAEEFADELLNATSDAERNALWAAHPEHHKRELVYALVDKNDQAIKQYDFERWVATAKFAIDLAKQLRDESTVAALLNNLAVSHDHRGDQTQALEYYLKSLDVSDHSADPRVKAATNSVRSNLGTIYADQGNYEQALIWYQRGLNQDRPQPWVLSNIANAHLHLRDYGSALDYYNRVLAIGEQLTQARGRDLTVIGALDGIASVYLAQGKNAEARQNYEKALAIAEAAPEPTRPISVNGDAREAIPGLLHRLAKLDLARGNATSAVKLLERAMSMGRSQNAGTVADLEISSTAARAYILTGQKERARELLDHAINGIEYRRAHAAGGEQGRQNLFAQLIEPYRELIRLLVDDKQPEEAFAYAEASKARALLDVLASGHLQDTKFLTAEEAKRDRELRRHMAVLNRDLDSAQQSSDQPHTATLQSNLEKARLEYEAFQTNLYSVHPELRISRGDLTPITLRGTAELFRDPGAALIEYVVTPESTYLFVITKRDSNSQPALNLYSIPTTQTDLEKNVERLREQIANRDPNFQKNADDLFSLLLKPATAQLTGKSNLIIVPDGILWDLPFQALRTDGEHYLIERSAISYAPSLTALREMQKRPRAATSGIDLVALGNPRNGSVVAARIKTGLMDYAAEPLPEAEKQVVALGRLYGSARSEVYVGAAATEEHAKAELPRARVIQFATHGILDSRSPMYSHLVLSQSNDDEDGMLEAWEVMKLDLHADLVVLAACETARGRVSAGEGMIGMSWAFFVAGAPATVASQWKVDSASTTELMLEFHRELKSSQSGAARVSKAKALRLASLKLLKSSQYQHPFYWAGFVLIGEGD